jgi:acetoin utilization protein AcuB
MIVLNGIFGTYKVVKQSVSYRRPTTVADVMTTGVVTLSPNDSFDVAIELMIKRDYRHLIVADDKQKFLGVISDRDIIDGKWHISEWRSKQVHQVMAPNPITVTPETLLSVAISTMLSKNIDCLAVVNNSDTVCGIVTSKDTMKSHQKMLEAAET